MSRFAKVDLLEVDDSVAGRVQGLEGRFGRKRPDARASGSVSLVTSQSCAARWLTATGGSRRPTSLSPALTGSCSTRPRSFGAGMSSVSRPRLSRIRGRPRRARHYRRRAPKPEEGDGVRAIATWPPRNGQGDGSVGLDS
jgi:hypothetical protein